MDEEPRFIRIAEVSRITSLQRSALYARISAGTFPAPKEISSRCSVWLESEVREWARNLPLIKNAERRKAGKPVPPQIPKRIKITDAKDIAVALRTISQSLESLAIALEKG